MNTNIIQLNSYLPSWIDPDPEVVRREHADLYTEYQESWKEDGKRCNNHVLNKDASKKEQQFIAQHLMQRMADEVLKEALRKIDNQLNAELRRKAPNDLNTWFLEFDCTVATIPYWLTRGIGYRLRPAVELLSMLSGNNVIKKEFDGWLPEFIKKAEGIKKTHISLGRGLTRTTDMSAMMLPLIYDVRDELRKIVVLAEHDMKLAGLLADYENYINQTFLVQ
jgi:hypothetical protein